MKVIGLVCVVLACMLSFTRGGPALAATRVGEHTSPLQVCLWQCGQCFMDSVSTEQRSFVQKRNNYSLHKHTPEVSVLLEAVTFK